MIDVLNIETAHRFGDTLPAILKCRYREFVLHQKYDVPTYNHMEYDQYDTPAAVYFAWKDNQKIVRGGMRILPTTRPYMLQELWPFAIKYMDIPNSSDVWEATRFFIDGKILDGEERRMAHGEILCALLEFALQYGIKCYIGIAPPLLWNFTYTRCGWPAQAIGDVIDIGFVEKVQACRLDVSPDILQSVRAKMKIAKEVLSLYPLPIERNHIEESLRESLPYVTITTKSKASAYHGEKM